MQVTEKPVTQRKQESMQIFGNNRVGNQNQEQISFETQQKTTGELRLIDRTQDRSLILEYTEDEGLVTDLNEQNGNGNSLNSKSSKLGKSEKAIIKNSQEQDVVEFPFRKYCQEDSSLGMLKKMSYKIPLQNLYQLQETCTRNQNNPYCPITVFIRDAELQKKYGGRYLTQVWYDKRKLFQKVNTNILQTFKMIGEYFIFSESPADQGSMFVQQEDLKSIYHIVKFSAGKVQFRMKLKIVNQGNKPLAEHLAAIYKGNLIIASDKEARYLEIQELQKLPPISETYQLSKVEVQYTDFKLICLKDDDEQGVLKIHNIEQTVDEGGIMFVVERLNLGKLTFLNLEELSSVEAKISDLDRIKIKIKKEESSKPPSEILSYKSVICKIEGTDSYKQVGIALRKDCSVDLYYEYVNVKTIDSSPNCVYFAIDVDFNQIYTYQYGSEKGNKVITESKCDVSWMHSGRPFWDNPKNEKIVEFQEEFANEIEQYSFSQSEEIWKECVTSKLKKVKSRSLDDQDDLLKLLSFYFNRVDEGLQSICSNYVELYSSFINNGLQIIVSHDRFISSYNCERESWDTKHLECEDFVREMFRSRTTEDGKILQIGILVGYQRFRFLQIDEENLEFSNDVITIQDPIQTYLNDIDSQRAFYFICQNNAKNNDHYFEEIDKQTWIHIPIQILKEDASASIQVLIDHHLERIDEAVEPVNSFRLAIQKSKKDQQLTEYEHVLIKDVPSNGDNPEHTQIHYSVSIREGKLVIGDKTEFVFDKSNLDEDQKVLEFGLIVGQLKLPGDGKNEGDVKLPGDGKNEGDDGMKLIQITRNHILVMKRIGKTMVLEFLVEERNIRSMLYDGMTYFFYTIQDTTLNYDNDMHHPCGQLQSNGMYVYDAEVLIKQKKLFSHKLFRTVGGRNSKMDFSMSDEEILFMKSFNELRLISSPHSNTLDFFGISNKKEYLIWHQRKGTFTAVNNEGQIKIWSCITGNPFPLKQNKSKTAQMDGIAKGRYQVYTANENDITWTRDNYAQKEKVISLIFDSHEDQLNNEADFKVLEMVWSQQSSESNSPQAIKIKFDDDPVEQISWSVLFTFKLSQNNKKRPYLYLSKDLSKLMVFEQDSFNPMIYQGEGQGHIKWIPMYRIESYPILLRGKCSLNTMVSPNFTKMIDYDFQQECFQIKDSKTGEVIRKIPKQMQQLTYSGKKKSREQLALVGQRILFYSEDEIRMINEDSLDCMIQITDLNVKSFVSIDNFDINNFELDRHALVDKRVLKPTETFARLIRRNAEFKQDRMHMEHQLLKDGGKGFSNEKKEFGFEQIWKVDYSDQDQFLINQSFTILDWLIMEHVVEDESFYLKNVSRHQAIQMCFNILPKFKTFLHLLADKNNFKAAGQELSSVKKVFLEANSGKSNDGVPLRIPLIQDQDEKTPLDLCLDEASLNVNFGGMLFDQTKDYPLLHSSYFMNEAVIKAITLNIPGIGDYLDSRLVPTVQQMNHKLLKQNEIKNRVEICQKGVGWSEFGIWENKDNIKKTMFNERGFKRKLQLCYFDIPNINDRSKQSNRFFDALALHSNDMTLYDHLSVNIIIEKAWNEHRNFFIGFFMIPYIVLILAFTIWSHFLSNFGTCTAESDDSYFGSEIQRQKSAYACWILILIMCSFFLLQEVYQVAINPKDYFNTVNDVIKNIWDLFNIIMPAISPTYYIYNITHCGCNGISTETTICEAGKLTTRESLRRFMFYIKVFTAFNLWAKFFYYAKVVPQLSYIVRAIISIIRDLMSFFFLYVVACFAFADAFHSASQYQKEYSYDEEGDYYESYRSSFINSYTYMMASTGELDFKASYLALIVFFAASVFIYLVLMNLLIARVGTTFGEVMGTSERYALRERAELIQACRDFPLSKLLRKDINPSTFLFVSIEEKDEE